LGAMDQRRWVEIAYQPGHPFGFASSIYLAEAAVCRPLGDQQGVAADLKNHGGR